MSSSEERLFSVDRNDGKSLRCLPLERAQEGPREPKRLSVVTVVESVARKALVEALLLQIGLFARSRNVVRILRVCSALFLFTTLSSVYLLNTHTHIYTYRPIPLPLYPPLILQGLYATR